MGFGRARETDADGVYKVAIEYEEEALGRAAVETARDLLLAAIHDRPCDVAAELERLRNLCQEVRLGPSTAAIAAAARARRHPGAPAQRRATCCSWAGAPGSGASGPPRPIGPAPSPSRSPRTRS